MLVETLVCRMHRSISSLHPNKSAVIKDYTSTADDGMVHIGSVRERQLESLKFESMGARQMNIRRAHKETCHWFLQTHEYIDWVKLRDKNFLWIKGKPGAGKSTLMNFILSHTRRVVETEIVLSFFFNARGNDLEKSTEGLYRTILLQLLQHYKSYPQLLRVLNVIPDDVKWTVEALETCFEKAIRLVNIPIICFIDALDECDETQIRDMVLYLSEIAVDNALYICFTSRHYPNITMKNASTLVLETQEEHAQDIARYIDSKLHIVDETQARQIRRRLQEKASGVFLWVVLVVDILNREDDHGGQHNLLKRLDEIPTNLETLFRAILDRPDGNTTQFRLCIQWILFARRPLTVAELYFAIIAGTEPDTLATYHSTNRTENGITDAVARNYILDKSRGLTEVGRGTSYLNQPTVLFIHESVRDFFLEGNWLNIGGGGLENFQGQSHHILRNCCLAILQTVDFDPPEGVLMPPEHHDFLRKTFHQYPLLMYAVHNILYHSNNAETHGVSQVHFLQNFPSTQWRKYHNSLQNESALYPLKLSLLYHLTERAMPALIRIYSPRSPCFGVDNKSPGPLIFAALATRSGKTLQALLEVLADSQPQELVAQIDAVDLKGRTPLSWAAEQIRNETSIQMLLQQGAQVNVFDHDGRTPLLWATQRPGNENNVKILLEQGGQVDAVENNGRTPLSWAAGQSRNENTIRVLLEHGAHPDDSDNNGRTPLSWAASQPGNEKTLRLLLRGGAQVDASDDTGRTPLSWAVENPENKNAAKILLEQGAKVDIVDNKGRTPLSWAAGQYGRGNSVRLLLGIGADINAPDRNGRTPLSWAAAESNKGLTVMDLLRSGANIDAADHDGRTPLSWAAAKSNNGLTVRFLLRFGADIDAPDHHGRTPLSWARQSGNEGTLREFPEHSAQIDAANGDDRTMLSWARRYGNQNTLRALLESGAQIDTADSDGRTPLSWAAAGVENGFTVATLLGYGADVHMSDKNGRTPLSWAAGQTGNEITVWMLLKLGAQIKASDRAGRAPLSWAATGQPGNENTVRMLLHQGAMIDTVDLDGRTQLSWAVAQPNNLGVVRILVEHGAYIDAADNRGRTPLSWAVAQSDLDTVNFLLDQGAQFSPFD